MPLKSNILAGILAGAGNIDITPEKVLDQLSSPAKAATKAFLISPKYAFSDTAKTTPAVIDGLVAALVSVDGTYTFEQANPTYQMTLRKGQVVNGVSNGKGGYWLDNTTGYMDGQNGLLITPPSLHTILMVLKPTQTGVGMVPFEQNRASNVVFKYPSIRLSTGNAYQAQWYNNAGSAGGPTVSVTQKYGRTWDIVEGSEGAAGLVSIKSNKNAGTATRVATTYTIDTPRLGAAAQGANVFVGGIGSFAITNNYTLSNDDYAILKLFIATAMDHGRIWDEADLVRQVLSTDIKALPLPQPTSEAEILPYPPGAARALNDWSKSTVVIDVPASMGAPGVGGGNGVYWPSKLIDAPSSEYPSRKFVYFSTDHASASGGIFLSVVVGNPLVQDNWKTYEDAVTAGWLNDIPNKPATNPIFVGSDNALNHQIETPFVEKFNNLYVMTYQANAGFSGTTGVQATIVATSADGVNFDGNAFTAIKYNSGVVAGDGHTGYLCWAKNPFPKDKVPYDYIGYSLCGGGSTVDGVDISCCAMWGTNDPSIENTWTLISGLNFSRGRAMKDTGYGSPDSQAQIEWVNFDPSSIVATKQGYAATIKIAIQGTGNQVPKTETYEILLADDGYTIIGKPIKVVSNGAAGSNDEKYAASLQFSRYGDKNIGILSIADSSNLRRAKVISSPLRNPKNVYFEPLSPAIPQSLTTVMTDFKAISALPVGWTVVSEGDPTAPVVSFSPTNGLNVSVLSSGNTTSGKWFAFIDLALDFSSISYVDIYVKDWISTTTNAPRIPYIGFSAEKSLRGAMQNALFLSNDESTNAIIHAHSLIAGSKKTVKTKNPCGYNTTAAGTTSRVTKSVGIRYFPASNECYLIGYGKVEAYRLWTSSVDVVSGFDKTKTYYPFIGFIGAGALSTDAIASLEVTYG